MTVTRDVSVAGRVGDLAKVAAIVASDASRLASLHCAPAGPVACSAAQRAAQAVAALDESANRGDWPEALLDKATCALHAVAVALGHAKLYALGSSACADAAPRARKLAPPSHHQRCVECGKVSLATSNRSAVTFRNRHRRACPTAEFENVSLAESAGPVQLLKS